MFNKHYVGLDLTGFEKNGMTRPVSRVTLYVDDENVITAGDDTGLELTADCPHATQEMADAILASVKGYKYQMYTADAINVDPLVELGDGITAGGIYSVISRLDDDGSGYPNAEAPGAAESEDEFPTDGPITQAINRSVNRKIAETRSSITKTAEEIRLEVTAVDGRVTTVSQTADKINWLVKSGTSASNFTLTDRAIRLVSDTIDLTGFVTFTNLSSPGQTTIDGGNIKANTVSADKLDVKDLSALGATIGGWTIGNNGISYGTDGLNQVVLRPVQSNLSNGVIYVGTRDSTSSGWTYPFEVKGDGSVRATKITISGDSSVGGTLNSPGGSLGSVGGTFTGIHSGGTLSNTFGSFYGGHYSGVVSSCNLGGTSLTTNSGSNAYVKTYSSNNSIDVYGGAGAFINGGSNYVHIATSGAYPITINGMVKFNNGYTTNSASSTISTESFGDRVLPMMTSASSSVSDYGVGVLNEDGMCYIVIDPIFSETVNPDYMPTVFLTKYGKEGDIWVEDVTHDVVLVRGTPGIKFAWDTRYQQANIAQGRLRNLGFENKETFGAEYEDEAAVWIEHNTVDYKRLALESLDDATQPNIDYAEQGYEIYEEYIRGAA